jgi:hypothetical protein
MRGYLSPVGRDSEIPVEAVTEVYRDPGDSQQVLVEFDEQTVSLGVADPTVSRKKGGQAPVRLVPQSEAIELQNRGNTNGVSVNPSGRDAEIEEGYARRLQDTTVFQIGYQTRLELKVEREERFGHVEGDVMLGGTKVEDAVVGPEAQIGAGDGGGDATTKVDDSVVGPDADVGGGDTTVTDSVVGSRASVGGEGDETDTESFCSTHQLTYRTPECPKCEVEQRVDSDTTSDRANQSTRRESKFCIYCGASIPAEAGVCSDCGEDQPSA